MYQKGQQVLEPANSHQFVDIIMDSQSTVKEAGYNNNLGEEEESYEFVDMDSSSIVGSNFKQVDEFSLDSEFPHWMELDTKTHEELPWWRMTHKDDLASFVAQRSHDFMENCDLPQPHNTSFSRSPRLINKDEIFTSSSFGLSNPHKHQSQDSATIHHAITQNAGPGPVSPSSTTEEEEESGDSTIVHEGEMDPSKRKLLEALCHSQTRAREAEKAAKQAYEEKEHVVKLIFKQASQLFAYKQWLYLLQLENLYNQIKSNNKKIAPIFPGAYSPWHLPPRKKAPTPAAKRRTPRGGKRGIPGCKLHDIIGDYAVAFAVGLGLVGAGLLLGWTIGWMFI